MTENRLRHYSGGMISEFDELSCKIDLLAQMTLALRRENAGLRHANAALSAANLDKSQRMAEAQRRIEALLQDIPALVEAGLAEAAVQAQQKDAQ